MKSTVTSERPDVKRHRDIVASFTLAERFLYMLSKDPAKAPHDDFVHHGERRSLSHALDVLQREFPDFLDIIRGKRVLDYGCGDGYQVVALARAGAGHVTGVEINPDTLERARQLASGLPNVSFSEKPSGLYDVAISLASFEHFPEPEKNLSELAAAICSGGKILITFSSLWMSPWGGHMDFFTSVPWVHLIFPERSVFKVRQLYRNDNARGYSPWLNKMTVGRFESLIRKSGLKVERCRFGAVKNIPVVSNVPLVREFLTNRATCILTK
jgi:SAM-dependent methyltransferase